MTKLAENPQLLSEMKVSLGLEPTSQMSDMEVSTLIGAAIEHLVARGLLTGDETYAELTYQRKLAIYTYVKANYGFDNPDADRLNASFRRIVCDLLNTDGVNGAV